jgi:hypothetical protein
MIAPDVEVEGKGIILISSEEGETEGNNDKFLKDLGIVDGSILTCDDFLQSYTLKVSKVIIRLRTNAAPTHFPIPLSLKEQYLSSYDISSDADPGCFSGILILLLYPESRF